jgi:hypothetical protein
MMSIEQNKAIVHRLNEEIWNQKRATAVDKIFTPDFVAHRSARPAVQGVETMRHFVTGSLAQPGATLK